MKEKFSYALLVGVSIGFGITLVRFVKGEEFLFIYPALYGSGAFLASFIYSLIFERKPNEKKKD